MKKIFNLDGKTAVVTGASSGLGKHFAKTLSAAGANLVICARRMQNLEELKDEIDGEVLVLPLDVTSEDSVKELFSEINNSVGTQEAAHIQLFSRRLHKDLWSSPAVQKDQTSTRLLIVQVIYFS